MVEAYRAPILNDPEIFSRDERTGRLALVVEQAAHLNLAS
jgi:hypothetical protein